MPHDWTPTMIKAKIKILKIKKEKAKWKIHNETKWSCCDGQEGD